MELLIFALSDSVIQIIHRRTRTLHGATLRGIPFFYAVIQIRHCQQKHSSCL